MKKLTLAIMSLMMLAIMPACKQDAYGDLFIKREPVTFRVMSDSGKALSNVSLKTEELDAFDYDLIVDGTHYAYTDVDGMATVDAVYCDSDPLLGRTTRFTFTATDYAVFDTVFNSWEGTIDIVLYRE